MAKLFLRTDFGKRIMTKNNEGTTGRANTFGPSRPAKWREIARTFNDRAEEYDRWFADSLLFDIELAALRAIMTDLPRPRLEIGVGPGRFAGTLDVDFGIDPAVSPLQLAGRRGIMGINAIGEQLPLRPAAVGTIFLLFTFCFLADPAVVLRECSRVIKPGGRLVLGIIPQGSSWGMRLGKQGQAGHPYYRHARFRTIAETAALLAAHGFSLLESWSTLLQEPERLINLERPQTGTDEQAGFCVLVASSLGGLNEIRQPDYPDY